MSLKNILKDENCTCLDAGDLLRAALTETETEPCALHGPAPETTPAPTGPAIDLGDGAEAHARALLGATTRSAATRDRFLEALHDEGTIQ